MAVSFVWYCPLVQRLMPRALDWTGLAGAGRAVWYWRDGTLQPYALRGERYEAIEQSEVLDGIELALLVSFLDRATTYDAIRDYRAALAAGA